MVDAIRNYLRAFLGVPNWDIVIHGVPESSSLLIVVPEEYDDADCESLLKSLEGVIDNVVVIKADELSVLRIK